jgi:membrane-bound ClpP family serine protease
MSKTKVLLWASMLALVGMPFLYIGGQNGSAALMGIGFTCFVIGMLMAPINFVKGKLEDK